MNGDSLHIKHQAFNQIIRTKLKQAFINNNLRNITLFSKINLATHDKVYTETHAWATCNKGHGFLNVVCQLRMFSYALSTPSFQPSNYELEPFYL